MEYEFYSHHYALEVLETVERRERLNEILEVIEGVTDDQLIHRFSSGPSAKSISKVVNDLLKEGLVAKSWTPEAKIFQGSEYTDKRWRLDFAKKPISVEVAFNHGEAIAWNLLKPVLASQLNHVKKEIEDTDVGVVICATEEMKVAGNFDSAVGEFEKFIRYLRPLQVVLPTPILLIGLKKPRTFYVEGNYSNGHNKGTIVRLENQS